MAYIGNTVQNQGFTPAIDYFNGNGVTVTFTLSRPVASVAQMIVAIDNVIQNPSSSFTVAGNAITFTSAPLAGTNNIWVEYTSLITTYQGISQDPTVIGDIRATGGYLAEGDFGNSFVDGNLIDYVTGRGRFTVGELDDITFYHGGTSGRSEMMDLYYAGGAKIYGTTALTIPVGTTAERPGTPAVGMTRYNSTTNYPEYYNGSSWTSIASPYSVDYLVVAGGASGGNGYANTTGTTGGGGAGGLLSSSGTLLTPNQTYAVTVGAGGAGVVVSSGTASFSGNNGSNSSLIGTGVSATATGGGAGGSGNPSNPGSGGSGGGGGSANPAMSGGSGTSGQGFAGGSGGTTSGGGGGGGAGGVGANAANGSASGSGGLGYVWLNGTTYASGGGGGGAFGPTTSPGAASAGGGTAGGVARSSGGNTVSNAATANTGGGSGGSGSSDSTGTCTTGAGGSGVVIIRYSGTVQKGSGGTVTTSGGYTYHTFTSSGTYTA